MRRARRRTTEQALLICCDAFLVLELGLDIANGVELGLSRLELRSTGNEEEHFLLICEEAGNATTNS